MYAWHESFHKTSLPEEQVVETRHQDEDEE